MTAQAPAHSQPTEDCCLDNTTEQQDHTHAGTPNLTKEQNHHFQFVSQEIVSIFAYGQGLFPNCQFHVFQLTKAVYIVKTGTLICFLLK